MPSSMCYAVTKDARRATRIVCGGARTLRYLKRMANRRFRRQQREAEVALVRHRRDADSIDWAPRRPATGWDVA